MLANGKYRSRLTLLIFVIAISVGSGVGIGALFFVDPTPEVLREDFSEKTVPVTERTFADPHTVEVTFSLSVDTALIVPTTGRVSAFSCQPGGLFISGGTNISVEGDRLLNLATTVPLWRDLRVGDKGEDVLALHEELARLGYPAEPTDKVNRQTLLSVIELFREAGESSFTTSTVPMSRFIWLPDSEVTTRNCNISLGSLVTAGQEIVSLPGSLLAAQLVRLPERAVSGERTLMIDGVSVPVDSEGKVADAEGLVTISRSAAYAQALRAELSSINGIYVLTEPPTISVIPPGSLYKIEGETACVTSGAETFAVKLLASELGQSFVTFLGGTVPELVDLPPKGSQTCS